MRKLVLLLAVLPLPVSAQSLGSAIKAVARNCTVDLRYASISACPNGEDAAAQALLDKDVPKALPDLANAFASKDEKESAAALSYIYRAKDYLGDVLKNPKLVQAKTVDTFLKALGQNKNYVSFYGVQLTTVLATATKKEAALFKVLDAHPQDVTRNEGYRWAMNQGRLRVFDKIKKAATDTKKEYLSIAALNAPEYMYNYNDKEKNAICEWEKKFLDDENPRHTGYAARVLVLRCLDGYIDLVLDKAEKLKNEGKLANHPLREALTNFTFSCQEYMGAKPTGTEAQCARKEVLLKP